jgi:hypothetical protein
VTDASDLYGLPLERFVPERGALAKSLRGQGRREEASRVAGLRKPSIAAWAVNQLARTQHREIEALFDAGDALQRVQADLLAGRGEAAALREAGAAERDAVDTLLERARGLLTSAGHELTPATLEKVAETLHAAALEEEARAQVREACLERELRHVGLGAFAGDTAAAPALRRKPAERERAQPARKVQSYRERGQPDRKLSQRERAQRVKAARKAEEDARRAAERAHRALDLAIKRRDQAAAALRAAEAAVSEAQATADAADLSHRRAQAESERA